MNVFGLLKFIAAHPLNRSSRLAAFGRFVRWQVGSRCLGRPVALPFVNDTCLLAETGLKGATGNFYTGLHEVHEMGFALHVLRPGELFADLGANVGSYTVLASAAGARVIAVEPVPATFACLERNIRLNAIDAEAHCCGLSDEPGELPFTIGLDAMNKVATAEDSGPTVLVPVRRLDDLLGGRVPYLMKIDVEGHEPALLAGAAETLAEPGLQAVLMETTSHVPELLAIMAGHGFKPYAYDALERQLAPAVLPAANVIFLRDIAAVQERCRSAPRFTLVNGSI